MDGGTGSPALAVAGRGLSESVRYHRRSSRVGRSAPYPYLKRPARRCAGLPRRRESRSRTVARPSRRRRRPSRYPVVGATERRSDARAAPAGRAAWARAARSGTAPPKGLARGDSLPDGHRSGMLRPCSSAPVMPDRGGRRARQLGRDNRPGGLKCTNPHIYRRQVRHRPGGRPALPRDHRDGARRPGGRRDLLRLRVPFALPAWPARIEGRAVVIAHFEGYGDRFQLDRADELVTHISRDPGLSSWNISRTAMPSPPDAPTTTTTGPSSTSRTAGSCGGGTTGTRSRS